MLDAMRHSLIRDPLFSVRDTDGNLSQLNLAEVFVQLTHNNILSFEALQKHQIQAWQSFLVQTAAMALGRAGLTQAPTDVSAWQNLLITLADGHESAWNLFVHDLSKPAFMQSPIPEGSLAKAKYDKIVQTPDDLDVLITAKNHEIKMSRIINPQFEHWIYALIILQTMQGRLGQGNFGIVRMNGSLSNRPKVGYSPGIAWGEQFNHELNVLLSARAELTQGIDGYDATGAALLWIQPWNGETSTQIFLPKCDPFFVEICRRIRVISNFGILEFRRATTKSPRIGNAKKLNGITNDPWTPIEIKGAKSLTISSNGYNYRLIQQLLLGEDFKKPIMLEHKPRSKDDWFFIAHGLVRGQGKTEGLHERIVPIPYQATLIMRNHDQRQILAKLSEKFIATTSNTKLKVLQSAIMKLFLPHKPNTQPSKNELTDARKKSDRWTNAFEANVDDIFFTDLWTCIDKPGIEQDKFWQKRLYDLALEQLNDAIHSAPMPSMRRYRIISAARDQFEYSARNQLPALFPKTEIV